MVSVWFRRPLLVAMNSRYTHSNPAVCCLKNYAGLHGYHSECLEFHINGQPLEMLSAIVERKPDLVGFSCYIWNYNLVVSLSSMLKKVLPDCRVLWGGPQMKGRGRLCLRKYPQVDYVLEGEGELGWTALLALSDPVDLEEVPNLFYRQSGDIRENPPAPPLDLSELPNYYTEEDLRRLREHILYYESSRGCPFGCKFCLSSEDPIRYRALPLVLEDLRRLIESGCRKIKFVDRTFNSNPRRAVDLLRGLLDLYREGVCFHLELEPLCLSEELVSVLLQAPAGYFQAEIGVQSLYEPALRAVGRHPLQPKAMDFIKTLLAKENIHLHLDLIAGLPYEGLADFKDSFNGLYQLRPHYLQLGFLKILPGTPLAAEADSYGLVYMEEPPYQVLRTPWLSYEEFCQLAVVETAVDGYYNEMFFEQTLDLAVEQWRKQGGQPFDFFYELGTADRLHPGGKNQAQKGRVLYEFLLEKLPEQTSLWRSALRLDFSRANQQPPAFLGEYNEMGFVRAHEELFLTAFPRLADLPRRKWLKQLRVFSLEETVGLYAPGVYVADFTETAGIWRRPRLVRMTGAARILEKL